MNNSTAADAASGGLSYTDVEKACVVVVLAIIAVSSLVLNLLVDASVFCTQSFHKTGYAFMVSLSCAEMVSLVVTIVGFPVTYAHHLLTPQGADVVNEVLGFCHNISYFTTVPHHVVIAFNRYCSVRFFQHYARWFNRKNTFLCIVLAWLFGITVNIPLMKHDTRFLYAPSLVSWAYDFTAPGTLEFLKFDLFCGVFTSVWIVLSYTALIINLVGVRQRVQPASGGGGRGKSKKPKMEEVQLSLQFLSVSMVYVFSVVFFFTAMAAVDNVDKWLVLAFNILFLLNYSANPWIYITFNKKMRRRIWEIVTRRRVFDTDVVKTTTAAVSKINHRSPAESQHQGDRSERNSQQQPHVTPAPVARGQHTYQVEGEAEAQSDPTKSVPPQAAINGTPTVTTVSPLTRIEVGGGLRNVTTNLQSLSLSIQDQGVQVDESCFSPKGVTFQLHPDT